MLRNILKGTGVAIITPFTEKYSVDFIALEKLIDYIIDGGVNYIVSLGTTGETPALSIEEKKEIISFTVEKINNRVPVVVGVGSNNTSSLIEELQTLPLKKAVAVLSASPYYNKPSQRGIVKHYEAVAMASPLPVILYNVPARTGKNMTAETTLYLAENVKNIAGIKEASGDMAQCMHILRDRPEDFLVVSGDDALAFPQITSGMDGVISVAANVYPKTFSEMISFALAAKNNEAKQKNDLMIEAYRLMFAENNPAGAKAFLSEMNIIKNVLRLPNVAVEPPLQTAIEHFVQHNNMG